MRYWLMKSEPSEYSIDDLVRDGTVPWFGVRNYQARNFMRDQMRVGDGVLFYHSTCAEPGVAGLAEVGSAAYPDESQFEVGGKYHDPKAGRDQPRWFNVDVKLVRKTRLMSLAEMREAPKLARMRVLAKGNRLSITPVDPDEWAFIVKRLGK
jgi:predicted RNA-binding protein with PUA-like domain